LVLEGNIMINQLVTEIEYFRMYYKRNPIIHIGKRTLENIHKENSFDAYKCELTEGESAKYKNLVPSFHGCETKELKDYEYGYILV
jgi:hypothetical protein